MRKLSIIHTIFCHRVMTDCDFGKPCTTNHKEITKNVDECRFSGIYQKVCDMYHYHFVGMPSTKVQL